MKTFDRVQKAICNMGLDTHSEKMALNAINSMAYDNITISEVAEQFGYDIAQIIDRAIYN